MIEALYWWDQAVKFKEQALASEDRESRGELLELANACEAVAAEVEDRATGG